MWIYVQRTGRLLAQNGSLLAVGYAGHAEGKNNPAMQDVHNVGPLPCGGYTLCAPVDTHAHGPYVLFLTPDLTNQMFGRTVFRIHGEKLALPPGSASEGCIILPHAARVQMWESGDHRLRVISGLAATVQ